MIEITENMLDELREKVMERMSTKRFLHTIAVEQMVARLCALFCTEQTILLRAAALLHDVTKERTPSEQVALCRELGLAVSEEDLLAPKIFHAKTAAALIPMEYQEFAHPIVVDSVRWHTTGRAEMSLPEKLLYLADYIDESRTFENCVRLRSFFWDANPEKMESDERLALLRDTLILSYRFTIEDLIAEGLPVAIDTVEARNRLLLEKAREN